MTESRQSDSLTTHWVVHHGATCAHCGSGIRGRVEIRVGDGPAHQMSLATARDFGRALVSAAMQEEGT